MGSSSLTAQVAVSATLTAFLYEAFSYNVVFLGRILPALGEEDNSNTLLILFNVTWGMALWSYIRVSWADPGTVPGEWHDFVRRVGLLLPISPGLKQWQPGQATMCRRCSVPRPERAHHCNVCGVCVLRLDHHCPWINNCVGWANHKFFLQTCFYSWLACLIAVGTSLPQLVHCARSLRQVAHGQPGTTGLHPTDELSFLVSCFLAMLVTVFLSPLLFMQIGLAFGNRTTIEDNYAPSADMPGNPFDQGNICANLVQIFGSFGLDWLFPVTPWSRLFDGMAFPSRTWERLGLDGRQMFPDGLDLDTQGFLNGSKYGLDKLDGEELWRYHYRVPDVAYAEGGDKPGPFDYMMGCMMPERHMA